MAKDRNKELIDDIVDKMKAHELPYKEGAWERFASKNISSFEHKKSTWKYWSAAAAVLLLSGASYVLMNQDQMSDKTIKSNQIADQKSLDIKTNEVHKIESDTSSLENNKSILATTEKLNNKTHDELTQENPTTNLSYLESIYARKGTAGSGINAEINPISQINSEKTLTLAGNETKIKESPNNNEEKLVATNQTTNNPIQSMSIGEQLSQLKTLPDVINGNENQDKARMIKKWELAAYVAPSSTADRVSLGGGLSMAYQVTDKLSIRSGVSMQEYGAGANRQNNLAAVQSATQNYNESIQVYNSLNSKNVGLLNIGKSSSVEKELSGVTNRLLTVDIPVDVRYHVNKSLYTSVGVSYVGVLSQTQDNYFVEGINQDANSNSVSSPVNVKQSVKGNSITTNDFNGFINFSVGKKMKAGKKLSIAVEPFVKLPVGGLKSAELNYTNGGLKIITSF